LAQHSPPTLERWAVDTLPFLRDRAEDHWETAADTARLDWSARAGLLRRRLGHAVTLRHDRASNRIQWMHGIWHLPSLTKPR
jgi:hypothetical protein